MSQSVDIVEWHHEVPRSIRRQVFFGLTLLAFAFGGFGTWALTAPLAAAVISQGTFVATGRNKIVQHLEGGIIEALSVAEGDIVQEGDVIIQLNRTEAEADRREMKLRQARLEAAEARIRAELDSREQLTFPAYLHTLAESSAEVGEILADERLTFLANQEIFRNDIAILENGVASLKVRGEGYVLQLAAYEERSEILSEELVDKRALLESGHIRRPELNALRRAKLESQGHVARLASEVKEIERAETKLELEIEKLHKDRRQDALEALLAIQSELDTIRERARKAEAVLERSNVLAPVDGTVVRLHYRGPGGVIETGKPIAEILPADAPLLIETTIPRNDVDSVVVGQWATVRLSGLNQRTTPVLRGRVAYLSADSVTDMSQGAPREVYVAHIDLPQEEYGRVRAFAPMPGMPAEIMIQLEERTFFEYLVKPIQDSMSRAFREL